MIFAIITAGLLTVMVISFSGIRNGLPVLMYHKVSDNNAPDYLTVSSEQIAKHFSYLTKKKYTTLFLSELTSYIYDNKPLPARPVLITFDDGYKNNFTTLYPLLKKYNIKANIFLVAGFIQYQHGEENNFLHVTDIHKMDPGTVEFGLHSYDHKNYIDLSIDQVIRDVNLSRNRMETLSIPYQQCLAYPFGAYPKRDKKKRNAMFNALHSNGIQVAFRIGNRINKLLIKNKMLIQRIDVRGDESFFKFKISLRAGRKFFFK